MAVTIMKLKKFVNYHSWLVYCQKLLLYVLTDFWMCYGVTFRNY